MQSEVNSGNNNLQVEDKLEAVEDNAMEIEKYSEDATISERLIQDADVDADADSTLKKTTRGPTKMKKLSYSLTRIEVEFNALGEPIGAGSVKLSSYLGPLVREHVPVTLKDWRQLSDELKVVLWKSIQARFKLDEEWQKVPVFQQMGCIWRSSKCRVVRKIINARSQKERLKLKPKNIKSMEWKKFIKLKTSSNFKALSEKFKAMRRNQMQHTCGRKGMARLAEDLRQQSDDPSSISRVQVWIKSRIRKNGEPVSMVVADTIEKIKKIESESQSSSITYYRDDTLSQVLGQDKPGRLRGLGRGVNFAKSQARGKQVVQFESRISELEETVRMLMENQSEESWRGASTTQVSKNDKVSDKCDLLDWSGTDEIVAEGRIVSSNPNELVHKIPLGPNAMKILIDCPRKADAFLWRPAPNLTHIGQAEDEVVAWPANRVVLRVIEYSDKEENVSKPSSTYHKCKLYDWCGSEELVAEGRLYSSDPKQLVNDIPLGPFAMVVWIDKPKKQDAFLWRPAAGMTCVGEAVGSKVAWPESKVVVEKVTVASPSPMVTVAASPMSANFMPKNKCKLIDSCDMREVDVKGRVPSTDPNSLVHFVPLERNAVNVLVELQESQMHDNGDLPS